MDKNVLIQYCDMKEEIKDLRRRITETEKQIWKIAEEGTVKDTVSGGMGGIQHFVVEGMPVPELSRKKLLLNKRKAMLIEKENELLELTNQVEQYISSIFKIHISFLSKFRHKKTRGSEDYPSSFISKKKRTNYEYSFIIFP